MDEQQFINLLNGFIPEQTKDLDFWLSSDALVPLSNDNQKGSESIQLNNQQQKERYIPEPTREPIKDEKDKRKRNTEASARFRLKKKQEQVDMKRELEVLKLRVVELESQLKQKELEVEWLRGFIKK